MRKKRALATIDTIPPGRAPVGFFQRYVVDRKPLQERRNFSCCSLSSTPSQIPSVITHLHGFLKSDEEHNNGCGSQHLTPPLSTRTPTPDTDDNHLPFSVQQSSPSGLQSIEKQNSNHQSHLESTGHTTCLESPLTVTCPGKLAHTSLTHHSLDMASGFGPSMTSQARAAEFNAATAARVRHNSDELDDLSVLRSSQPVSLGAITATSHSRNKGSRSWKPLTLRDTERPNGTVNLANNQFMPLHDFDIPKPHSSTRPLQASHTQNNENKLWFHELRPHIQKNPLSHTGNTGTGRDNSIFQRPYYSSTDHTGDHYPGRVMATQDNGFVAHGGKAVAETRRNTFGQSDLHKTSAMPDSTANACNQSLYSGSESSHVNSQQDMGSFTRVPGQHQYQKYGNHPPEQSNLWPEKEDSKYSIYPSDSQTRPDANLAMAALNPISAGGKYKGQHLPLLSTQPCASTEGPNLTKAGLGDSDEPHMQTRLQGFDAKREVTAYLKSVVEASKCNEDMEACYNPMARMQILSIKNESEKTSRPNDAQYLYPKLDGLKSKSNPSQTQQEGLFQITSVPVPQTSASPATEHDSKSQLQDTKLTGWEMGTEPTTNHNAENLGGNISRAPPPGLSKRAASSPTEPILSDEKRERLEEANRWFHNDGRGQDEFRRLVLGIAQTEASKCKPDGTQPYVMKENRAVEPYTLLLGDVIANLRSYVLEGPKTKSDYFSNYGDVPAHCCEPSHGGRRSYFDRDPSADQWRLPTGRPFNAFPYGSGRVSKHQDS